MEVSNDDSNSQENNMVSEFITYLDSKKDELSGAIDNTLAEKVSQVKEAFKTLEESVNKQLENNDKLSNEDINEMYHIIEFFIKLCALSKGEQDDLEIDASFRALYGPKIDASNIDEMESSFQNFIYLVCEVNENLEVKKNSKAQEIITKFLSEKYSDKQLKQSIDKKIYEIFDSELGRKFWEKCNIKFERKQDSNNKFLIIGGTLFSSIIITGIGYLAYDKLYKKTQRKICKNKQTRKTQRKICKSKQIKKTQRKICKNKRTPAVSAAAA